MTLLPFGSGIFGIQPEHTFINVRRHSWIKHNPGAVFMLFEIRKDVAKGPEASAPW